MSQIVLSDISQSQLTQLTYNTLYDLKQVHTDFYTDNHNDLMDYICDILDNINNEVLRKNRIRAHIKHGGSDGVYANNHTKDTSGKQSSSDRNISSTSGHASGKQSNYNSGKHKSSTSVNNGTMGSKNILHTNTTTKFSLLNPFGVYDNLRLDGNSVWRTERPASANSTNENKPASGGKQLGLLSQMLGADKIKVSINRELNKLSPTNLEIIFESITDIFSTWLIDELNKDTDTATLTERYTGYQQELWSNITSKMLSQANLATTYFALIDRCCLCTHKIMLEKIKNKTPVLAARVTSTLDIGLSGISIRKQELLGEIMQYLRTMDYFTGNQESTDNKLSGLLKYDLSANIDTVFHTLGLFVRNSIEVAKPQTGANRRDRRAANNTMYDVLLLAFYDNFKHLNELICWDPVVIEEVEKRVYLTIGFLENNKSFVQSLDMDFYRDIECELDSLKRCSTIPTTIKFKLLDCIDNFISTRNRR